MIKLIDGKNSQLFQEELDASNASKLTFTRLSQ